MYGQKKCMKCGEPATHKFTRIEKGQIFDLYFCPEHAAEVSPYQKPPKIPLSDILEGLLKQDLGGKSSGPKAPSGLRCANCGLPFEAYKRNLLLGCSECYESFREFLVPDLRKIHGDTRHVGRRPPGRPAPVPEPREAAGEPEATVVPIAASTPTGSKLDPMTQIERLAREMQEAIEREDYPHAAVCRDEIRKLKELIESENPETE